MLDVWGLMLRREKNGDGWDTLVPLYGREVDGDKVALLDGKETVGKDENTPMVLLYAVRKSDG